MNLDALIAQLENTQLLRRADDADPAYVFKHALTQEAAYQSLLLKTRREIHRRVAQYYEATCGDEVNEYAQLLAHHYAEAGDDAKTVLYATLAGHTAAQRYANTEAIAHYSQALEAAQRVGQPVTELHLARGQAYELIGAFERAQEDNQAALDDAEGRNDRYGEWQALMALGFLWASRDYARAGEYFERALGLARALGDPPTLAHSLNRVGNWHVNIGQPFEAQRYHQEALAIFQRLNHRRGLAETFDLLAMAHINNSERGESQAYSQEAITLFRELNDRQGLASSLPTLMLSGASNYITLMISPMSGDAAETMSFVREGEAALKIAQDIGWRAGEAYALQALAECLGTLGEFGRALALAQESLRIAEEIEHRQWVTGAHCVLGALYRDLLALPTAREHLEQALPIAQQIGSRIWLNFTTAVLASVCLAQQDDARAESLLAAVLGPTASTSITAERLCWAVRAELALARGEPHLALDIADQLITATPGRGAMNRAPTAHVIPQVWELRGEGLAALGRTDEAEATLRSACEAAQAYGLRPLLWRIHAALGRLYRGQARAAEARRELARTRAVIQELAAGLPDPSLRQNFRRQALALASA